MTILTPTRDLGAKTVPATMVVVSGEAMMTPEQLSAMMPDLDLNGQFLADLMSAFLAHEQCGTHLYRTVSGLTQNPALKRRYTEFLGETENHVDILTQLITDLGGDPMYVSPAARLTHGMDTKLMEAFVLLAGSAEMLVLEMAMLEGVMLAEAKDHANWTFLHDISEKLPEGPFRDAARRAVSEVVPQETEHLTWAQTTWARMAMLQTKSTVAMKVADFTEKVMGTVANAM